MFTILMVLQMYSYVQTYQIVHFIYVQCIAHQLYIGKTVEKEFSSRQFLFLSIVEVIGIYKESGRASHCPAT